MIILAPGLSYTMTVAVTNQSRRGSTPVAARLTLDLDLRIPYYLLGIWNNAGVVVTETLDMGPDETRTRQWSFLSPSRLDWEGYATWNGSARASVLSPEGVLLAEATDSIQVGPTVAPSFAILNPPPLYTQWFMWYEDYNSGYSPSDPRGWLGITQMAYLPYRVGSAGRWSAMFSPELPNPYVRTLAEVRGAQDGRIIGYDFKTGQIVIY